MDISLQKDDLLKGIQTVQGAVSSKMTLPILGNILLEAEAGALRLTATDLDIAISRAVPAEVAETGSITVPAKRFFDIIKEAQPNETVRVVAKKNLSVQIESGKSFFRVMGMARNDFP